MQLIGLVPQVALDVLTAARLSKRSGGGRTWWAHFEFTRINIEPTILPKKIEELMNVPAVGEKNFLKLKPQLTVASVRAEASTARH